MTTRTLQIVCDSEAATMALGERLGRLLFPGSVVALLGPLGAGKTAFSRGIAAGLGIDEPASVTSPTFVLIQEYVARLPIYHFDTYRLKQLGDFEDLGALEYFAGDGVCLVEWADRVVPLLPDERLQIEISLVSPTTRNITFTGFGSRYAGMVEQLTHPT